jgi:hypothetical protein
LFLLGEYFKLPNQLAVSSTVRVLQLIITNSSPIGFPSIAAWGCNVMLPLQLMLRWAAVAGNCNIEYGSKVKFPPLKLAMSKVTVTPCLITTSSPACGICPYSHVEEDDQFPSWIARLRAIFLHRQRF